MQYKQDLNVVLENAVPQTFVLHACTLFCLVLQTDRQDNCLAQSSACCKLYWENTSIECRIFHQSRICVVGRACKIDQSGWTIELCIKVLANILPLKCFITTARSRASRWAQACVCVYDVDWGVLWSWTIELCVCL